MRAESRKQRADDQGEASPQQPQPKPKTLDSGYQEMVEHASQTRQAAQFRELKLPGAQRGQWDDGRHESAVQRHLTQICAPILCQFAEVPVAHVHEPHRLGGVPSGPGSVGPRVGRLSGRPFDRVLGLEIAQRVAGGQQAQALPAFATVLVGEAQGREQGEPAQQRGDHEHEGHRAAQGWSSAAVAGLSAGAGSGRQAARVQSPTVVA